MYVLVPEFIYKAVKVIKPRNIFLKNFTVFCKCSFKAECAQLVLCHARNHVRNIFKQSRVFFEHHYKQVNKALAPVNCVVKIKYVHFLFVRAYACNIIICNGNFNVEVAVGSGMCVVDNVEIKTVCN